MLRTLSRMGDTSDGLLAYSLCAQLVSHYSYTSLYSRNVLHSWMITDAINVRCVGLYGLQEVLRKL